MDLFGKKAQQQVEDLQKELEETQKALEETEQALERYKDKFQRAETEKQDAHRDRKEAEQRLQNLQQTIESDTEQVRDILPQDELQHVLDSLQDVEFRTAHAYTAYLPAQDTVLTDEQEDEIVFFDPYTTGVVLYPPVPVEEDTTSARTFQTAQVQEMVNGAYLYVHLSENGSGAALITEQSVEEHVLVSDADVDQLLENTEELREQEYGAVIVTGEEVAVKQFTDRIDENVVRTTSKVMAVNRKSDLQQAFDSAFTVECRRLTDEDIEHVRGQVF